MNFSYFKTIKNITYSCKGPHRGGRVVSNGWVIGQAEEHETGHGDTGGELWK